MCNHMSETYYCEIGKEITRDMEKWTRENVGEVETAAKKIQHQMKRKLDEVSPVRDYPYNNGTVMKIIVFRSKNNKKAIKKPAEHQPGTFKKTGWLNVKLKENFRAPNGSVRFIYAVRKKDFPTMVHLLNFDHDLIAHGKRTGVVVHGSSFVSDVQKWGVNELDKKIKEVFGK